MVTLATGMARSFAQLLAARMALGVGEASNMAPTSALIADLFPGPRRVLAMAVFSAGGPLAIMLCYPLIGWIAQGHGWRLAFPLMGVIGLVVAGLTLWVVREPPREAASEDASTNRPGLLAAARLAAASPAFWLVTAGGTMFSVNYSAMLGWLPAFMGRLHGLDASETGLLLGTYKGLIGVIATLGAGVAVTWLMRLDRRWLAWAPAGFCAGIVPAQLLLLLGETPLAWHIGLAAETVLMAAVTPCLFALVLALFDAQIRATGIALYLLVFNLVGQSVGPVVVGMLNDGPLAHLGAEAVRYSLLAAPAAVGVAAGLLFALSFRLQRGVAR
jgi:predicted MFS family arabinose efflux permease